VPVHGVEAVHGHFFIWASTMQLVFPAAAVRDEPAYGVNRVAIVFPNEYADFD
jgi:hypothetical protein